jgi:hypothetical protein
MQNYMMNNAGRKDGNPAVKQKKMDFGPSRSGSGKNDNLRAANGRSVSCWCAAVVQLAVGVLRY